MLNGENSTELLVFCLISDINEFQVRKDKYKDPVGVFSNYPKKTSFVLSEVIHTLPSGAKFLRSQNTRGKAN